MASRRFPYGLVPSFSLRTLFVGMLAVCMALGGFAYKLHQARQQTAAVETIRKMGGVVKGPYTKDGRNVSRIKDKWYVKLLGPDLFVAYARADLRDRSLSEDDLRKMLPYLRKLTSVEGMNVAGKTHIVLDVWGNPAFSERLIDEIRETLPNCDFGGVPWIPRHTAKAIQIGMSAAEVIDAVGEIKLSEIGMPAEELMARSGESELTEELVNQGYDWIWKTAAERQRMIQRLGSAHHEYTTPDGRDVWTYFIDNVGIAVLGVEFDANGIVSAIWSDRGSPPPGRQLTRVAK